MMATSLTRIYAAKPAEEPQRRHAVTGRASFAFSNIHRAIAKAVLSEDFAQVCPVPHNPVRKWFASALPSLAA
ncbi:MAG: hypothetical protein HQL66_05315 [Magnetococcales bacterium]|nr:hypothetical protein [Magnetococcales bacterium]